jgi:peroxiredoxin
MALTAGDPAPDFSLRNQHGETVACRDFRGRANLVVVFYPWAFSRVCSGELVDIRDNLDRLRTETSDVVAISCDAMYSLRIFAERDSLDFSLLSDFWPHGAVARAFGVFDEALGISRRTSFIVDRSGVVRWVVENDLGQARDLADYARVLAELG